MELIVVQHLLKPVLLWTILLIIAVNKSATARSSSRISYSSSRYSYTSYTYRYSVPSYRYTQTYYTGYYYYYYNMYYYYRPSYGVYLYSDDVPAGMTVCQNFDINDNGTYLGYFQCPLAFEPSNFIDCCGDINAQYCCQATTNLSWIAGAVVGAIAFIIFLIVIIHCCRIRQLRKRHVVRTHERALTHSVLTSSAIPSEAASNPTAISSFSLQESCPEQPSQYMEYPKYPVTDGISPPSYSDPQYPGPQYPGPQCPGPQYPGQPYPEVPGQQYPGNNNEYTPYLGPSTMMPPPYPVVDAPPYPITGEYPIRPPWTPPSAPNSTREPEDAESGVRGGTTETGHHQHEDKTETMPYDHTMHTDLRM